MTMIEEKTVGMRLYCLPYAGGLANVYLQWQQYLDPNIELYPIELAGRGKRWKEPTYNSLLDAADDVFTVICNSIEDKPYAVWGHSMGTLIAYELSHVIKRSCERDPEHLLLSGCSPPHIGNTSKKLHQLGDEDFLREVLALGGTTPGIFENKGLTEIIIPILKSDYKNIESYEYKPAEDNLNCDISIFFGLEDMLVKPVNATAWAQYTNGTCNLHGFAGGHFFIHEEMEDVVAIINSILTQKLVKEH